VEVFHAATQMGAVAVWVQRASTGQ